MKLLKKNTFIQKNKNSLAVFFIFLFFGFNLLQAQVQNNGILYIKDAGLLYIKSVNFNFGAGSSTKTSTTASTFGKLIFDSSATYSGAASGATQFVDGYASTISSSYFILPTGQTTTYAPIGITNAAVISGVSATYTNIDLSSGAMASSIATLPTNLGIWQVSGDNAKLTLIWSSDISALSNTITDLTIAGFNTSINKWEAITSAIPTGSLNSGTIQTSSDVVFGSTYSGYTLAKHQQEPLGNSDFGASAIFATINNETLKISASLPIADVTIYDLTGRLVTSLTSENQTQVNDSFLFSKGVYIVKIKMSNGLTLSQKLINN